jgi:RNA polymerase sigma-70 factor, ECF subfamily
VLATTPTVSPTREPGTLDPSADELVASLYRDHRGPLLAFTMGLTGGDRQRAEDVVQETLLRAWRHANRLTVEGRSSLRPWLCAVARRIVIDGHRSRKVRPAEIDDTVLATLPAPDDIDRLMSVVAVQTALRTLGPAHREVLFQTYYQGCTSGEVASAMRVPVGTVKSRVYYALRALRAALENQGVLS